MPARSPRLTLAVALATVLVAGIAPVVRAVDNGFPYFACAIGSGHLSTPTPVQTVAQGRSAVFTIDIERIGCDDSITFEVDPGSLPAGTTATFSENPSTAASITLTLTTSVTTPVGPGGAHIYLDTGHNWRADIYLGVDLDIVASPTPVSSGPTPGLVSGTLGTSSAPVRITWGAVDPDGIRSYTLQRQRSGGAWSTVKLGSATSRSITQSLSFGVTYRYRVRATDRLGHVGAFAYGRSFTLTLAQQTTSKLSSSWIWTTMRTSHASGGSYRTQPYSGSDFTYTFSAAGVAWVTVKGPTRSDSTEVFVDGVNARSNMSLTASTTQYRKITFARNFGGNGSHSLWVANLGRIGHSRLDVDAFVLLRYS